MLGDTAVDSGEVEPDDVAKNKNRGLIPRCVEQIFAARDEASGSSKENSDTNCPHNFVVTATMVEIYNEDIKDLLGSAGSASVGEKHEVKHCLKTGDTTVTHLKSVEVRDGAFPNPGTGYCPYVTTPVSKRNYTLISQVECSPIQ